MATPGHHAGTCQEEKVVDTPFLNDFALYSRQFVGFDEESVQVALGVGIEFPVDFNRATVHAVSAAFREEVGPLLLRELFQALLKAFKPIRQFHNKVSVSLM